MKHIVIFSNCAGNVIKNMFEKHSFTKDKYFIHYISNYQHLNKQNMDDSHVSLLNNCDIFMYQPLNQNYTSSAYDITPIKQYLPDNAIILKINFYRFRGFWYNSEYKPYDNYNNYKFLNKNYYGIHDSFINVNTTNKNDVIDKINNLQILRDELLVFFDNELLKFKILDENSDVQMFAYFLNNYKIKQLFHDPFHPTNLFFYEIFRQIIIKLDNYKLKYEDYDFIHLFDGIEMTHWALPILPIVKNILDIKLGDFFHVFYPPDNGDEKIYMDIYDYYYIRLSHQNFKNYLDNVK
jgi:hypothetical protein